jgi:hypothetical protein
MSRTVFVVVTSDPDLPVVFGRSDALAGGMSLGQVHRRLAAGRWSRVRWGTYTLTGLDEDLRWRAQVLAVSNAHQRQLVLSHAHAARAWSFFSAAGRLGVDDVHVFRASRGQEQ